MFDESVAVASTARGGSAVAAWARVEAAACARRLAAMVAMLDARQSADDSASREQWYLDNWGAVCAEIGAAQ
ncbi:MAG TPA: HNH endonuclease, partial [Mycobacterium sp.]|nr:HNH endonuclease [Mycobacterium sp.]